MCDEQMSFIGCKDMSRWYHAVY